MGGTGFMILIALVLIPHPMCSLWVAVVIISVDTGVIGFMTLWGISLDTVSMITIIMSIGFAVDFAAHTAHAFVASGETSAAKRIPEALGSIGWPSLQGGLSTVLGVVVLSDLDSYMIVAFFKTVFLVIILAVVHGLIFLPVLLSIFVPARCQEKTSKTRSPCPLPTKTIKNEIVPNVAGPVRIFLANPGIFLQMLREYFAPNSTQNFKGTRKVHEAKSPLPTTVFQSEFHSNVKLPVKRSLENSFNLNNAELSRRSKMSNRFGKRGSSNCSGLFSEAPLTSSHTVVVHSNVAN